MNPLALKLGAYGLILGALWLHGCSYGQREAQQELAQYRASVEAAGKQAQKDADIKAAKDKENAHASDLSYAKALTVLGSDIERLRKSRAGSSYVPAATPDTRSAETGLACFARDELEQAIRRLDEGVSRITQESDTVRLRLSEAISWSSRLNQ